MSEARQHESLRQQLLLRVLWGDDQPGEMQSWLRQAPARQRRGLQVYQANAGALAERALAAACPTVAQLVGDESFAALARALWRAHPPRQGDVATWGGALPAFIEATPSLSTEAYLADVARLDWAVHVAERAADDEAAATGLDLLASHDPAQLQLRLRHGHAVLVSAHPVHTIWQAHRQSAADRFAPARQALAERRAEAVRVRRAGLQVAVDLIDPDSANFEQALGAGLALGPALDHAGAGFDFEAWFLSRLREGGVSAVVAGPSPPVKPVIVITPPTPDRA